MISEIEDFREERTATGNALFLAPAADPLPPPYGSQMATTKVQKTAPKRKKASSKGALVKGVSAKLPIDLLNEPTFKQGLQEITRGYSGLYFLYKKHRLY